MKRSESDAFSSRKGRLREPEESVDSSTRDGTYLATPVGRVQSRMLLLTLVWIGLVLSATFPRAVRGVPAAVPQVIQIATVFGVLWIIAVRLPGVRLQRKSAEELRLLVLFLCVPLTAAGLAMYRSQAGDSVNQVASMLSLLFVYNVGIKECIGSLYRALSVLIGASLIAGLLSSEFIEPNARAYLRGIYDGRLSGFFGAPNSLGVASVMLVISALVMSDRRAIRVALPLALSATLAASSQTSLLVVGASLAAYVLVLLLRRRSGWGAIVWIAGTSGIVLFFLFSRILESGAAGWFSGGDLTFSNRTQIWSRLLSEPVSATGLGQSGLRLVFSNSVIYGASDVSSAHSMYVDAYVRDGVFGAAALAVLAVGVIAAMIFRRAPLALVPVAAMLSVGVVEVSPTHVPFYAMFFTLMLYCLGSTSEVAQSVARENRARSLRLRGR